MGQVICILPVPPLLVFDRVRKDLSADPGQHLAHCRSTQCQSIFIDRRWSNSICNQCQFYISFDVHPSLSNWVAALCAKFNSIQMHDAPVLTTVTLLDYQLIVNNISTIFITTGPGAASASPGNIKDKSGPFFVDHSNSDWLQVLHPTSVCDASYLAKKLKPIQTLPNPTKNATDNSKN